jgi:hypothetical protein
MMERAFDTDGRLSKIRDNASYNLDKTRVLYLFIRLSVGAKLNEIMSDYIVWRHLARRSWMCPRGAGVEPAPSVWRERGRTTRKPRSSSVAMAWAA